MSLWLLNHFSTFTLAVITVGGTVLLAVGGSVLLRRRYPSLTQGEHNDMVGVTLGMFGAIYGIILAFVIVTLWTQVEDTQTIVATEATDAALIARDAAAFPPPVHARLDSAMSGYVHAVVEDQWPRMREGNPSYGATETHLRPLTRPSRRTTRQPTGSRSSTNRPSVISTTSPRSGAPASRWRARNSPCCFRYWRSAAHSSWSR
ncbi:hypothetical protein [Streptomyces sp. NPDC047071]|uniref:bestrophin-like domain n=1 Tax=Streptomyces sp. NPDC047071 TaxID=3154808 RepID=UPI00345277EC